MSLVGHSAGSVYRTAGGVDGNLWWCDYYLACCEQVLLLTMGVGGWCDGRVVVAVVGR